MLISNQKIHEHSGRFRLLDRVEIYYQIIGQDGPWVAAISGGRHAHTDLKGLARKIAFRGYRVIIHDRRNCGQSSLRFDDLSPEDDFWADDLYALLIHLNAKPAFVVGRSRGTRIVIRLVERHPGIANGIMLWGLSGGKAVARILDDYYYRKYLRACRAGGMDAVCALDHFADLIAARPENRELLLTLDPAKFISVMSMWRIAFLEGKYLPVMGVGDDALGRINISTAIVPYYNSLHPFATATYAHKMIPDSCFFDFDPKRRQNTAMTDAEAERDEDTVAGIFHDFYMNPKGKRFSTL